MRRVLFVTVGTSAITAKDLWTGATADATLRRDLENFPPLPEEEKQEKAGALRPRLTAAHGHFWHKRAGRQPGLEHYQETSAELVTTLGLLGSGEEELEGFFQAEGDTIVLLASNTAEGELSAWVNADVLHQTLLGSKCHCRGVIRNCQRVVVEVVRGMEPATQFDSLRDGLVEKTAPYLGARAAFNVTGGFKGAIPYITWLTFEKFPGAPMYYQHEKMHSATRIAFTAGANPQPKEERRIRYQYPRLAS